MYTFILYPGLTWRNQNVKMGPESPTTSIPVSYVIKREKKTSYTSFLFLFWKPSAKIYWTWQIVSHIIFSSQSDTDTIKAVILHQILTLFYISWSAMIWYQYHMVLDQMYSAFVQDLTSIDDSHMYTKPRVHVFPRTKKYNLPEVVIFEAVKT